MNTIQSWYALYYVERKRYNRNPLKEHFKHIHNQLIALNEGKFKGTQLYFSPLKQSDILFIGINPGIGYFNFHHRHVKRFSPLNNFEYNNQNYLLARETKKLFKSVGLSKAFSNAVKINHFPFATRNESDLNNILSKYDKELKLYYYSKEFVKQTIEVVQPKLIICEGKSSFDRLKKTLGLEVKSYNQNTYVIENDDYTIIGYKRNRSFIKNKEELKSKLREHYIRANE